MLPCGECGKRRRRPAGLTGSKGHFLGGIRMTSRLARSLGALALSAFLAGPALAQGVDELTLIAPASPGGGWDGTARGMAEVLQQAGLAKSVKVENVPGAG